MQVLPYRLAVLDDDDRQTVQDRSRARNAEADVGRRHLEDGDHADDDEGAGDGVVVLRQPLLDRVAKHDQQNQIERLQRGELAPPDHARKNEDERVEDDGSDRKVHYGKIVTFWWTLASFVSPS